MLSKVNSGAMNASDEEGKPSEPYHIVASLADASDTPHPYANESFVVCRLLSCSLCFKCRQQEDFGDFDFQFVYWCGLYIDDTVSKQCYIIPRLPTVVTPMQAAGKEALQSTILTCDVVIYDITASPELVEEASWAISCKKTQPNR